MAIRIKNTQSTIVQRLLKCCYNWDNGFCILLDEPCPPENIPEQYHLQTLQNSGTSRREETAQRNHQTERRKHMKTLQDKFIIGVDHG